MSASQPFSLAHVVLFLGNFKFLKDSDDAKDATDILALSDNKRFEFNPSGQPDAAWLGPQSAEAIKGPILVLQFGKDLFSPEGWVFGSDSDSDLCDLRLAGDNRSGVSRRHFRIDINPTTLAARLTVLSTRGEVQVSASKNEKFTLSYEDQLDLVDGMTINLGVVWFQVWSPTLTFAEGRAHRKRAKDWNKEIVEAERRPVASRSKLPETITANFRTGRDGAVYINLGGYDQKGMTASVMRVQERLTGRVYGAKEPYYNDSDDYGKIRARVEELRREYQHIINLQHPYIVNAVDFVLADDYKQPPWLIMEYIPQTLDPESVQETDVPILLTQVCAALAHMHANDIAHRDVKPNNILIENIEHQGRAHRVAKLADFGTARKKIGAQMETFTGTPEYMAPELLRKDRKYTSSVDLFSVGLIALQLFERDRVWLESRPWSYDGQAEWMRDEVRPRISAAPEQFQPMLMGLLEEDPQKRWTASRCLHWLSPEPDHNIASAVHRPLSRDSDFVRSTAPSVSTGRAENAGADTRGSFVMPMSPTYAATPRLE